MSVGDVRPDSSTRFSSRYADRDLLDLIRDVALHAAPDAPLRISTRRWDAARVQAGHPQAPSARRIVARLNPAGRHVLGWGRIVELALSDDPAGQRQALTSARRRPEQPGLDISHLDAGLRRVARKLDRTSFSPEDYTATVDVLLGELPEPARTQLDLLLPTVGQIERIARNTEPGQRENLPQSLTDWSYALHLAGLQPRTGAHRRGRRQALTADEIIAVFAATTGTLPSAAQARTFASHNTIAAVDLTGDHAAWTDALQRYRADCTDQGTPVPPGPTPRNRAARTTIPGAVRRTLPHAYTRRGYQQDPESMLPHLVEYLNLLDGRRPTLSHYRQTKKALSRNDWPSPSTMGRRLGSFTNAMDLADARRRAAPRESARRISSDVEQ